MTFKRMQMLTREEDSNVPEGMAVICMIDNMWVGTNSGWPSGQPALYKIELAERIVEVWNESLRSQS